MDSQTDLAPTTYGAPPLHAHPAQVDAAHRIAARVVVVLSALGLVGVVALSVVAAADPGEYSGLGHRFALFLLVPVLVALALLAVNVSFFVVPV